MQNIKYAENICDSHSFPVYKIPPTLSTWYDAIIFKAAKFKIYEGDTCMCFHQMRFARASKHLLSEVQVHSYYILWQSVLFFSNALNLSAQWRNILILSCDLHIFLKVGLILFDGILIAVKYFLSLMKF